MTEYRVRIQSGDIYARLSIMADTPMGASDKAFQSFRERYHIDNSTIVSISEIVIPEESSLDREGYDMRYPADNEEKEGDDVKWL